MSQSQAEKFAAMWSVADQVPNTELSGFSATIFKNTQTGKYALAIGDAQLISEEWIANGGQTA